MFVLLVVLFCFYRYMINWINGHTDRFKCLVNHCGVFDSASMYYTTEELYFSEFEFHGAPPPLSVTEPVRNGKKILPPSDLYVSMSPSSFVDKWKTPTLVIHGERDFRVPIAQGIATFTALQRRGIVSEFLVFRKCCLR